VSTYTDSVVLESDTCGKCGGVYALNKAFVDNCRRYKGGYNCPYCQTRWSWNESEADRLRKQLETKERELRESKCESLRIQQLREQEQVARKTAERKLRRVNKGVCHCCNRSFENLQRHMATKHPEVVSA